MSALNVGVCSETHCSCHAESSRCTALCVSVRYPSLIGFVSLCLSPSLSLSLSVCVSVCLSRLWCAYVLLPVLAVSVECVQVHRHLQRVVDAPTHVHPTHTPTHT